MKPFNAKLAVLGEGSELSIITPANNEAAL